ncbi:MAG: hypothetical protein ABEK50_00110, partial [bacterium]
MTKTANSLLEKLRKRLRERPMRTDLEPVSEAARSLLDAPDRQTVPSIVQVVGSNGKGSVVHYLSELLSEDDRSLVSYTSPHLQNVTERIKVKNRAISNKKLEELLNSFPSNFLDQYTPFEALYLTSLKLGLREGADWLLLEAGMGGRWDATSALPASWVILTSLDREHTDYLGEDLREILREQVTQIPNEGHLITGPLDPSVTSDGLHPMIVDKNLTHVGLKEKTSADRTNRRLALTAARL